MDILIFNSQKFKDVQNQDNPMQKNRHVGYDKYLKQTPLSEVRYR